MIKRIRIALTALLVAFAIAFGAHSFSSTQLAGKPPKGEPSLAGIRPPAPSQSFDLNNGTATIGPG
jgi:hypothetical protein